MTIIWTNAVNWYKSNIGKQTYSQKPPRFDCSSSATLAFASAVGINIDAMKYSTVNLADLFAKNGLKKSLLWPNSRGEELARLRLCIDVNW
ncbi:peptidoglycan amidohydrolase family protein [Lactococcus fujiensis]|uniref:peptidoglycan amidohydrolase family protein n=1 Tax=Lactococcus fujiensis TaxID=610251 RepID=UPI0006D1C7F4|nr:peptidoglycan amidohydrolase family protein [Lactococcus fujiensis]